MNIENWLENNRKSLIDLIELEDVQSKEDPAEQPYRSQYAARDILHSCITNLDELMMKYPSDCDGNVYFLYFSLSYRLANNFISTEERYSGEEIINSIYDKIEHVPHINSFIQQLDKDISSLGDVSKSVTAEPLNLNVTESGENSSSSVISWIRSLAGILIKIYNTKGMLWASKIVNQQQEGEDLGFQNSFNYLNMAKKLYKKYKCVMKKTLSDTTLSDYDPPECIDSLLLNYLNYETPYLKYTCDSLENDKKIEAVKLDCFESDYTSTLFLLAQAFERISSQNSSMKHKSAKYCYKTLSRQLNSLKYDPVEWALNAATLSQYYLMEGGYRRARHCIAASQIILKEAVVRPTFGSNKTDPKNTDLKKEIIQSDDTKTVDKETEGKETMNLDCQKTVNYILEESLDVVIDQMDMKKTTTNEIHDNITKEDKECDDDDGKENIKTKRLYPDPMSESRFWDDDVYEEKRVQAKADIDRCWIKYGLTILENSFDRFMPDSVNIIKNDNVMNEADFPEFNLELDSVEKQVTCNFVDTFDDARELFLFIQKRINEARQYYKIDFRCSDAIELICDHSKAFKALSNFELSVERKCCMHKKRIDMLTDLLNTLNHSYYQIACRTMMLEVGEIYNTMVSLKMSLIETSPGSNQESLKSLKNAKAIALKIRRLAQSGVAVYQKFLDSYRTREGVIPETFSEDDIRPVMIAHFYMARMYSKIIEPEVSERVANLRKSLEHYKFIVSYCERHPNAAKLMEGELESCRDMSLLLPHKIHKLLN